MAGIFLSYAHADSSVALDVDGRLRRSGYHVFRDHDRDTGIPAGMPWARELFDALDRVDIVVLLASAESLSSPWCHTEVAVGVARGKHVIQVNIADDVGPHPVLTDRQALPRARTIAETIAILVDELARAGFPPSPANSWDPSRSPFIGLRQMSSDFAAVFFGRDAEISVIIERTAAPRSRPVLVVGASGCGKSSLLRAGVLPRLRGREGVITLPVVEPGNSPLSRFALALREVEPELDVTRITSDPHGIAEAVDRLTTRGQHLVACIDQAEDLLTAVERHEALDFISRMGHVDPRRLSLVVALRSASMEAWGREPGLSGWSPADPVWVRPLDRSNLRQTIVGPAKAAGIRIEPPELVEEVLDDVGDGRALPLLAALLEELAEGHSRTHPVVINRARYQEVGPVARVIERRAEAATHELQVTRGMSVGEVVDAFTRLADVDEDHQVTRTEVVFETLPPEVREMFEVFERNRLVTRDRRTSTTGPAVDDPVEVVTATHEVVFRAWPDLADAIGRRIHDLELRTRLRREAQEWDRAGGGVVALTGGRLAEALRWRERHPDETSPQLARFLDVATRQRRRRRALTLTAPALAAVAIIVALVALVLFRQVQAVTTAQRTTEGVRLAGEAQSVAAARPDLSLLLAMEAAVRGGDPRAVQAPFVALTRGPGPKAYRRLSQRPDIGAMSADGGRAVIVGAAGVSGIDTVTGREVSVSEGRFQAAAISADGSTVALAGGASVLVRPWGGRGVHERCQVSGGTPEVLRLSETGAEVVIVLVDRSGPARSTVLVRPVGSCAAATRRDVAGLVTDAAFGADDKLLAVAYQQDSDAGAAETSAGVLVMDTATGETTALQGDAKDATAVAMAGSEVAALDPDGILRVWRLPDATPVWQTRSFDDAAGVAVRALPPPPGREGSSSTRWLAAAEDGRLRALSTGADVAPPPVQSLPPLGDRAAPSPVALATRPGEALVMDGAARIVTWSFDEVTRFGAGALAAHRIDHIASLGDGVQLAVGADGVWIVDASKGDSRLGTLTGGGLPASRGSTWALAETSGEVVEGTWPSKGPPTRVGRVETSPVAIALVPREAAPGVADDARPATVIVERQGRVTTFGDRGVSTTEWGGILGSDVVTAVADERWLYLGLFDGRLAVLDLAPPTASTDSAPPPVVRTYEAHGPGDTSALAISGDGSVLASGGDDRRIVLWDLVNDVPIPRPALVGHGDRIRALSFSPDGRELASASEDLSVIRWDVGSGEPLADPVTLGTVADVAYESATGSGLVVAAQGVSTWPLDPDAWIKVACRVLGGRAFSDAEQRQILGSASAEAECPIGG